MTLLRTSIAWLMLTAFAWGKADIVVLPRDATAQMALPHLASAVAALKPGDQLIVFAANPVAQIAAVAYPTDQDMNAARIRAHLATQFVPVRNFVSLVSVSVAPRGALMVPALIDELARNVITGRHDKPLNILLIGSLNYFDAREDRWNMDERFYPSDGTLRGPRLKVPYSTAGAEQRLTNTTLHFCSPDGNKEFVSTEHEARVKRFWSLYTTTQSGRVGTMAFDLATCFRRFMAGESSGQPTYQSARDVKAEMLRVPLPSPATPPTMEQPSPAFLAKETPISRTPPSSTSGTLWIGIKWSAPCDLDLYARSDSSSPWLFYGQVRSPDGYFNKDWLNATGNEQYEFIEFRKPVDITKLEVAINLYSGSVPASPEGIVRIWFEGKVYEAPFRVEARSGNGGVFPMSGAHWMRIDVPKTVGLSGKWGLR